MVRALIIAGALLWFAGSSKAEIVVRVGMTNLATNTVNTGIVLKELKLFEKRLPHSGRYADEKIRIEWPNYTTGPQETNAMLAGRLDFAVMSDYPQGPVLNPSYSVPDRHDREIVRALRKR